VGGGQWNVQLGLFQSPDTRSSAFSPMHTVNPSLRPALPAAKVGIGAAMKVARASERSVVFITWSF
jgi:hypothetical protein